MHSGLWICCLVLTSQNGRSKFCSSEHLFVLAGEAELGAGRAEELCGAGLHTWTETALLHGSCNCFRWHHLCLVLPWGFSSLCPGAGRQQSSPWHPAGQHCPLVSTQLHCDCSRSPVAPRDTAGSCWAALTFVSFSFLCFISFPSSRFSL